MCKNVKDKDNKKDRKCEMNYYARAYVLLQKYEDLFTCKEAMSKGTIFKQIYSPYDEPKKESK